MPSKTVSIIIPTHNSKNYIRKCLNSAEKQTYSNIEIICVDDASLDETPQIITQLAKTDQRIKLIRKEKHTGVSDSRNIALKKAKGDYVFFLDADDSIQTTTIEKLLTASEKESNTLIGTTFIGSIKTKPNLGKVPKNQLIEEIVSGRIHGSICLYLFPKSKLKNNNFDVNTSYLEDTLFLVNFLANTNYEYVQFINYGYNYTNNQNSITESNQKTLKKCKDIEYSLNSIDRSTGGEYHSALETRKIVLIESQLQHTKTHQELKTIRDNIHLSSAAGGKHLRLFLFLYTKFGLALPLYYKIRKLAKIATRK